MSIQILPTRLANQIAAGEVVERPASVVKELVENSLDAGATNLSIDIEKGGAKKIRITDNGVGIIKDELTLALSRHATSKIKNLNDLEAISSLGFRGEALASISAVARLTLTSKPVEQHNAWQAFAQGRDMEVTIQPAAHPNGTTIEVNDLFFNTPARRKFLRAEKTEFSHIDEVVRRIALARFDVSITLTHNGKVVKQYRAAKASNQYTKRVAQVCGQKFIDNAIEIDCQHEGLHLWGWLGKPDYHRTQNNLCYSYVNGRMMRDKLINHGIRQAFTDLMPNDVYPTFVLFLVLDHKEVDVNVHPAKHEVRFHQGRYVHDFIFTVCHRAIEAEFDTISESELHTKQVKHSTQAIVNIAENSSNENSNTEIKPHSVDDINPPSVDYLSREYVRPLQHTQQVKENENTPQYQPSTHVNNQIKTQTNELAQAASTYQQLMTPKNEGVDTQSNDHQINLFAVIEQQFGLVKCQDKIQLLSIRSIAERVNKALIKQRWEQGLISQPLLLPTIITLEKTKAEWIHTNTDLLEHAGIIVHIQSSNKLQIRQFPSILREQNVSQSMTNILNFVTQVSVETTPINALIDAIAQTATNKKYDLVSAKQVIMQAESFFNDKLIDIYSLYSCDIDLTSAIAQLR